MKNAAVGGNLRTGEIMAAAITVSTLNTVTHYTTHYIVDFEAVL
jgi:hypothetical protein